MADKQPVSKSAKKNKKRKTKKKPIISPKGDEITPEEIIEALKGELAKAKLEKDHQRAGVLRDQIWVLTDMVNGVRTDIPDDDLEAIFANLPLPVSDSAAAAPPLAPPTSPSSGASNSVTSDREMKKLLKKLEQIQNLKGKLTSGEKLEKNQLDKIQSEQSVRNEIAELEQLLNEALQIR